MVSKRVINLAPSQTIKINEMAKQLKMEGKKVCNLVVGEPQNRLSLSEFTNLTTFINDGLFKYGVTRGNTNLRTIISDEVNQKYNQAITPFQIIISNGAKHSLTNTLLTILNEGDEVILLKPYWVSYPEMVKLAGGIPIFVETNEDLTPDFDAIIAATTNKTKAIIINNPNNPSGAVYPMDIMDSLISYYKDKDVYIISDEIYNELVFEGTLGISFLQNHKLDKNPNLIIINGVSKSFGLTGLRIGWTIANREITDGMTKIQGQTSSCASVLSQKVVIEVMAKKDEITAKLRESMNINRNIIIKYFASLPNLTLATPKGAFYAFPNISAITDNVAEFASKLLSEKYVATVPGSAFGMEGYLRMSYSCPKEELEEALTRFDAFILQ